ncbi:MAG TPA: glycosyltransferase [Patescibacteria group bacterium]
MAVHSKKIVIVFNSLRIGGIETKIVDLCQYYQSQKSVSLELFLKHPDGPLLQNLPPCLPIASPVFPVVFKIRTILFPFWLAVRFHRTKPDLIISFGNYSSVCAVIARFIAHPQGKLLISEDSSIDVQLKKEKYSFLRKILVQKLYPLADKIIVLTHESYKKMILISPPTKSKIIIRSNWLPFTFSSTLPPVPPSRRPNDILFIGRFEPQKNPLRFCRIIKKLTLVMPKVKVLMVGSGSLENSVREYIRDNGLGSNISTLPATIENSKMYLKSKILLLTSDHEGFPLTILESLSAGCLPVCRSLDELQDFFDYRPNLLSFKSESQASLRLQLLLSRPSVCANIINFYRHKVIIGQNINFNKTIETINGLL